MLKAPFRLEYAYKRSTGPIIGRFLTGLLEGRILGVKTADGRVLAPAREFDPATGQGVTEDWVEVGPEGTVTAWSWVSQPGDRHPLGRASAWALIRLDGADTALLHVVDGPESAMKNGLRVRACFKDTRTGHITDISHFEVAS